MERFVDDVTNVTRDFTRFLDKVVWNLVAVGIKRTGTKIGIPTDEDPSVPAFPSVPELTVGDPNWSGDK